MAWCLAWMGLEVRVLGRGLQGSAILVGVQVCRPANMRLLGRGVARLDVGCSMVRVMQEQMAGDAG